MTAARASWLLHRTGRELVRHPRALAGLGLAVAVVVALLGAVALGVRTAADVVPGLRRGVHVIVYLADDVPRGRAEVLADAVGKTAGVDKARLVTSEEALAELRARLGADAPLLDGVEEGFLPRSIEVQLLPESEAGGEAEALADRLAGMPGVTSVDRFAVERGEIGAWLRFGRGVGLGWLTLSLAAGGLALLLGVLAGRIERRTDAFVLGLVGETSWAARTPVALAGAVASALGASLGAAVLYGVFVSQRDAISSPLATLLGHPPAFLATADLLRLIVGALILGSCAGAFAIRAPRATT